MMENETSPLILQAKKISKSFFYPEKLEILKDVSLDVHLGQSIAIMGSSGEGKSTLLHILGTLEQPTSGELLIAGEIASSSRAPQIRTHHLGFVFQAFNLLDDYSALQNILMPALIAKKPIHEGSAPPISVHKNFSIL